MCDYGDDGTTSYQDICRYTCVDGFEIMGSSSRTCLSTGMWSNDEPLCTRVSCPTLNHPANGTISCSSGSNQDAVYEVTCNFTCDTGYQLTSGSHSRTCLSDGRWNGTEATCGRVPCVRLPQPANGAISCSLGDDGVASFEDTCTFTCNSGYEVRGSSMRTCQSDESWSGMTTTCARVSCPDLGQPDNGMIDCTFGDDGVASYQDTCGFSCADGYRLRGSTSRNCQSDRTWSGGIATCHRVPCDELPQPEHGSVMCDYGDDGTTSYQDICRYTCVDGFEIMGSSSRTCLSTGMWSNDEPMCTRVSCPTLNHPANGTISCSSGSNQDVVYEVTCNFTCDTGYQLTSGSNSRTCLSDGRWNGTEATCGRVPCVRLPQPTNGAISCSLGDDGETSFEDTCTFTCNSGYEVRGSSMRTCQSDESWSGMTTTCERVSCPDLGQPDNGMIDCTFGDDGVTSYQDTCGFSCADGYRLRGSTSRNCQSDGTWSGGIATCHRVPCDELPQPEHGSVMCDYGDDGTTSYQDICRYTCADGFEIMGSSSRTCLSTGMWSNDEPMCTRVSCPTLNHPANGTISCSSGSNQDVVYEVTCNFTCDTGYQLTSGSHSRTCLSDGRWNGTEATCGRVPCVRLPQPTNGAISCSLGDDGVTSFEDTCTFTCNSGYEVDGSNLRSCQSDGGWSGMTTTCERVPCPDLGQPDNGMIECMFGDDGVASYQDTCRFSCAEGYRLSGSTSRNCQSDGTWSGATETCDRVPCDELPQPEHGSVMCDYGDDGTASYQDVCRYTCVDGFEIMGSSSRTCLSTGMWSNDEPMCTRVSCPTLNHPANGTISCSSGSNQDAVYEVTCNFTCDTGYQLTSGSHSRTCLSDGRWNGTEATCGRVPCVRLPQPTNGAISCSLGDDGETSFEDTCTFTCNSGYEVRGSSMRTCQSDESWSGMTTTCARVSCPDLGQPDNGMIDCTFGDDGVASYQDTCRFSCADGYRLRGSTSRNCQSDGTWSGGIATCHRVPCDELPQPEHGSVMCDYGDDGTTSYQDICRYTCADGFEIMGSSSRTCLSTGMWSNDEPMCTRVSCPTLNHPANGTISCSSGSNQDVVYEVTCNFTCDTGYQLTSGSHSRTCLSDGRWNGTEATCGRVPCVRLPQPTNGAISCSLGDDGVTSFEDTCTFTCNSGYEVDGSNLRSCQSDGGWSGMTTTCERVSCPDLGQPDNGMIECMFGDDGVASYQDTCRFSCAEGYRLSGSTSRNCQSDGTWSGATETCDRVPCDELPQPEHGSVMCDYGDDGTTSYQDVCRYTCVDGFEIMGSSSRTCLSTGMWSNDEPMCTRGVLVVGCKMVYLCLRYVISVLSNPQSSC
ncbi:sushi, von Willebrand factor type A, EGF and pentraxin domain-containing protein 1-like [Dysidea avara]|uniref:sushi, von Willebrand factor type A, EGF and pentraxin domain-containing protein 1-like n=1 Tax=Dysidea avara TaxID=196820 RepID=UPI00332E8432